MKKISFIVLFVMSFYVQGQDFPSENNEMTEVKSEIQRLRYRVKILEELQRESSLAIRGLFKETFMGKRSHSFFNVSYGLSSFTPDDIENDNKRAMESINGNAEWASFNKGYFLDLEIGKKIKMTGETYLNISVGYQYWSSETIEGSVTNGGSSPFELEEKVKAGSIFIRSSYLNEWTKGQQFGGGLSFGYTPTATINYNISQNGVGVNSEGEGDGFLIEPFLIYEVTLSEHFKFYGRGGYRFHKIDDVQFNVADLITQTSNIEIDMSGVFGSLGLSMCF